MVTGDSMTTGNGPFPKALVEPQVDSSEKYSSGQSAYLL
jgi:hypothetical protein